MNRPQFIFRVHAVRRMVEREITDEEVKHVIQTGEVIENYPDDNHYPSELIIGWHRSRPIHVVAAHNHAENQIIVVTAYEPDSQCWQSDFKRRKI